MTGAALAGSKDDPPGKPPLTLPHSKKPVVIEAGSATTRMTNSIADWQIAARKATPCRR